MLAQSPPPACPADRPVDEIISEVHAQQSKMKHRNTNPFPDVTCIFGWCRQTSRTPPTIPEPAPQVEPTDNDNGTTSDNVSSSRNPQVQCDMAMESALDAAHDVDVGDSSFSEKNYRGALMRYQDAAKSKPQDAAIHVRLGRTYEKLKENQKAIEEYTSAAKMPGPKQWIDEADAAVKRLQKP